MAGSSPATTIFYVILLRSICLGFQTVTLSSGMSDACASRKPGFPCLMRWWLIWRRSRSIPQLHGQQGSYRQRDTHSGDAGFPSETVKELAQHGAADKAAEKVASQIGTARHAPIFSGGLTDEARG
jgi:hypothetical protein